MRTWSGAANTQIILNYLLGVLHQLWSAGHGAVACRSITRSLFFGQQEAILEDVCICTCCVRMRSVNLRRFGSLPKGMSTLHRCGACSSRTPCSCLSTDRHGRHCYLAVCNNARPGLLSTHTATPHGNSVLQGHACRDCAHQRGIHAVREPGTALTKAHRASHHREVRPSARGASALALQALVWMHVRLACSDTKS